MYADITALSSLSKVSIPLIAGDFIRLLLVVIHTGIYIDFSWLLITKYDSSYSVLNSRHQLDKLAMHFQKRIQKQH